MGRQDRNLVQEVTRWTASDSVYDSFDFGTPVVLRARWEDRAVLFKTPDGEEVVSNAVVYLSEDVQVGDFIALGNHEGVADPTTVSGVRVRQFQKVSNLRNLECIRKAFL